MVTLEVTRFHDISRGVMRCRFRKNYSRPPTGAQYSIPRSVGKFMLTYQSVTINGRVVPEVARDVVTVS